MKQKRLEKYFKWKLAAEIGPYGLKALIDDKKSRIVLVDVRQPGDFRAGHIPGAVNIPLADLAKRFKDISNKDRVIVYCYNVVCFAAAEAALLLAKKGYCVTELAGGFDEYKKSGFPVTSRAAKVYKAEAVSQASVIAEPQAA